MGGLGGHPTATAVHRLREQLEAVPGVIGVDLDVEVTPALVIGP